MKNTRYDPYRYNPDNTYLAVSDSISHFDPHDRLPKQEQTSPRDASESPTRRKLSRIFRAWTYFQLEFQIIAIFAVSAFLILWFLFNSTAFWKIFQ